ncbi:MAG: hypothetical protein R2795_23200 [Saprospiraceae bacterium]
MSGTGNVAAGTYTFVLVGTDGANTTTQELVIVLANGVPSSPLLQLPANMSSDVTTTTALSWASIAGTTVYDLQVSLVSGSSTVVSETGISTAGYDYWIVVPNILLLAGTRSQRMW